MKNTLITYLLLFSFTNTYCQDTFEPNENATNAAAISCGNFYNAYIQTEGDQDWYVIDVPASGALSVIMNLVPRSLDLNVEIHQMINGQLTIIADDDESNAGGGQDLIATTFLEPGRYFISVHDENNNGSDDSESYRIQFDCVENGLEVNQTIELATEIPQDTCFDENIWGENETFFISNEGDDDQEWFKVNIHESGVINAEVFSVPTNLDLNLEIYTIENNLPKRIANDDDDNAGGGQDLVTTAFVDAGTYYIHIEDENHNGTNKETFTFCLSFLPNELEVNQTIELATEIPQDTCFEESIWGENELFFLSNEGDDDQEWYKINIPESGVINAEVFSVPTNLDLNLEIYTIENNLPKRIANDDDDNAGGGQDLVTTAFVNAGTYYIHIEDENHNGTNKETFTFCLSFSPDALEVNQKIESAAAIPFDTCFRDNIWGENELYATTNEGDDDQDWFKIEFNEPCSLKIEVTDVPANLDLNLEVYEIVNNIPNLRADDGDGNSGGGQALALSTDLEPGTYYIRIHDENFNGTNEEQYNFCVSCENLSSTTSALQPEVTIFPNPTSGKLTVHGLDPNSKFILFDLNGRKVISGEFASNTIDLSQLKSGVYWINISNEKFSIVKRIVKI